MADLIPMSKLTELVNIVSAARYQEDFVDRLNYRLMTGILLTAAISIFAKDYVGNPIQCWGSAEWTRSWVEYAHDICFVENTYYIPVNNASLPRDHNERQRLKLGYYQWVPFLLVFLALFFLAPNFVWQYMNWSFSGIQLRAILSMINEARHSAAGLSAETRKNIAYHLRRALKDKFVSKRKILGTVRRAIFQRSLCATYFFVKFLYIANTTFQIWFLSVFLGGSAHFLSFAAIDALMRGKMWEETGLFPRVTICDFKIRVVTGGGHIENNSVQCVLIGNMINEKIFIMLLVLLLLLCAITVINTLLWLRTLFFGAQTRRIVEELLPPTVSEFVYPFNDKDAELLKTVINGCGGNFEAIIQLKMELDMIPIKADKSVKEVADWSDSEFEDDDEEITYNGSTLTGTTAHICTTNTMTTATTSITPSEQKREKLYSRTLRKVLKRVKVDAKPTTSCVSSKHEERLQTLKSALDNLIKRHQFEICLHNRCAVPELHALLGADGILVLELIRRNSCDAYASAILAQIFADEIAERLNKSTIDHDNRDHYYSSGNRNANFANTASPTVIGHRDDNKHNSFGGCGSSLADGVTHRHHHNY